MNVHLAYGKTGLDVEFPDGRTTVITPTHRAGLPDERAAFVAALEHPIASPPLREMVRPADRVCIVFSDITRATPNDRIIPWLLAELERHGARRENITLLNGLGTHRQNSRPELERLLTAKVVANYRVVNHDANDPRSLAKVGLTRSGNVVWLNRHLVEADLRIITGFIEPHFFAGFSGGPKGIMPGVAAQRTVERNHGAAMIAHPNATWGVTFGNPLWEEMLEAAQLVSQRLFLINVTLNERKAITRVFAGDLVEAHREGCAFVKQTAMQPVDAPFDVVVTTNSGHPLDLNLYQAVKGMSAAARVVRQGGTIIVAAECGDPQGRAGPFYDLLAKRHSPDALLELINTPGFSFPEQWQAQIQAQIQKKARVLVHSSLPDDFVRAAHLQPCLLYTS
ncbi:MAG: nickel-dependent lactate racemase, partial [Verrucomicrobiae bacterium]|nr:nickel-dependent lactate racemase [Verrucomicrobiae bacterium]